MPRIYIIRHAEAEGNLFRRIHGWHDGKITPNGRLQIESLEARLRSEFSGGAKLDALYASDLSRTMETAGALSRASGVPIYPAPQIREISLGQWEDLTWGYCLQHQPIKMLNFLGTPDWQVEGSETPAALCVRIAKALDDILAANPNGSIGLVSHAIAIRAMFLYFLKKPVSDFSSIPMVANASVSIFEYEGNVFTPVLLNDARHTEHLPLLKGSIPEQYRLDQEKMDEPHLWFYSCTPKDFALAADLWQDAWTTVYSDSTAFDRDSALSEIARIHRANPDAVSFAMFREKPVGILILDSTDLTQDDSGHITLFSLEEPFRGKRVAVQLLGQAIAFYRALGRNSLNLRVCPDNQRAIDFYRKNGFVPLGFDAPPNQNLLRMERPLN